MSREIGERRHIAGDDVEEMFRPERPVSDSAAQRIKLVYKAYSQSVGTQTGEVDRGESAAESAADDRNCLHGS